MPYSQQFNNSDGFDRRLNPSDVSVVPNAVDTHSFTPGEPNSKPSMDRRINVVILSRLVYRKGMDLAAEVIVRARSHCFWSVHTNGHNSSSISGDSEILTWTQWQ